MPPNKGEQSRRGNWNRNGPRGTTEPRTSDIQSNRNAVSQAATPQPAQAQSSARQSTNIAGQSNAQRSGRQPVPTANPPLWSQVLQNDRNSGQAPPVSAQRSGQAPPTPEQRSNRQGFNMANQNNAQRSSQQPVPNIIPNSYSEMLQSNRNQAQGSGEPPQAQPAVVDNGLSRSITGSSPAVNQEKPETRSLLKNSGQSQDSSSKAGASSVVNSSNNANSNKDRFDDIYRERNGTPPEPDKAVTKVENEFMSGVVSFQQDIATCVRPGYGSSGAPTVLWTNYLELKLPSRSKGLCLYSYNMVIDPEVEKKNLDHDHKPEGDKKRIPKGEKRRQLIKLLLEDLEFKAKCSAPVATDFDTTLITKGELDLGNGRLEDREGKFIVEYRAEGFTSASPEKYTIRVKPINDLDVSDLHHYSNPNTASSDCNKLPIREAFNVILGHYTKKADKLTRVGSRKIFPFNPALETTKLGEGLVTLRGYFTGAILATSRILVNVNVSHGAFYDGIQLKDLIEEYRRGENRDVEQLHRFLKRLRVKTTHLSAHDKAFGKIRTISGLAMKNDGTNLLRAPEIRGDRFIGGGPYQVSFYKDPSADFSIRSSPLKFESPAASGPRRKSLLPKEEQDRYVTVGNFFKTAYPNAKNAQNLDAKMPVVNVGTRAIPIYLPAEVCEVLPGQVSRSKLNARQTSNMINFAKCDPGKCAQLIAKEGRQTLGFDPPSETISKFGVTVSNDLITVPGRVLSIPRIEYKKAEGKPNAWAPSQGSWNLNKIQLLEPVTIQEYSFLRIVLGKSQNNLVTYDFEKCLHKFDRMMTDHGFNSDKFYDWATVTVQKNNVVSELTRWHGSFSEGKTTSGKPPLLVIILPSKNDEPYNTIKTLADTKLGFHTVCVIGENGKFYTKKPEEYNANVILKINLKLGGMNHKLAENPKLVENPKPLGLIGNGTTMVVGIDVTHPSHGSKEGAPSIFAVVASKDKHLSQWPVRFGVQRKSREEVISNGSRLTEMFKDLLKLWKAGNDGNYPQNIIVYRDGVSEGQYSAVIKQELAALREACNRLETKHPQMTLIVVAKRHHTRFYPTNRGQADSANNAKCGTVVDRGITQAQTWDFFLQSHSVIPGGKEIVIEKDPKSGKEKVIEKRKPSGTARPAHYVVLRDEIFAHLPRKERADELQQITHNMCYLYGPATKAISICPPVYLADKACTRARLYLSDVFRPPNQAEIDKRKSEKEEKDKQPGEKEKLEEEEERELKSYQERIQVHKNLKDTMFYI